MQWSFVTEPMEFRAVRTRTRKSDGKPYRIVVCEDAEGYQNEITCSDSGRFMEVDRLRRGEMYRFPVVVVATKEWQFARLGGGGIVHVDGTTGELDDLD